MGKPTVSELRKRLIKSFFDILILSILRKGKMSGYDIISFVQTKLDFTASAGTVYSKLYLLERNGLVEGSWEVKKRTYQLTSEGRKTIREILASDYPVKSVLAVLGINQD